MPSFSKLEKIKFEDRKLKKSVELSSHGLKVFRKIKDKKIIALLKSTNKTSVF